jgi:hypothetical protein
MKFVQKCSNALTIHLGNVHLTFWQRAMASVGRVEAHYTNEGKGTYASATLWGYMVSAQLPVALPKRAIGSVNLDWARHRAPCKLKLRKGTRTGRFVARVFAWGLTFPEVQEAIVAQFVNNTTPMCGVLSKAVRDAVEDRSTIDAENVEGLGRMIEEHVSTALDEHDRNFEVDADSIKGIEEAIEDVLKNEDVRRDIVGEVVSELVDRLRS